MSKSFSQRLPSTAAFQAMQQIQIYNLYLVDGNPVIILPLAGSVTGSGILYFTVDPDTKEVFRLGEDDGSEHTFAYRFVFASSVPRNIFDFWNQSSE